MSRNTFMILIFVHTLYYNIFEVFDFNREESEPVNMLNKYSDEIILIRYKNVNVN